MLPGKHFFSEDPEIFQSFKDLESHQRQKDFKNMYLFWKHRYLFPTIFKIANGIIKLHKSFFKRIFVNDNSVYVSEMLTFIFP